MGKLGTLLAFTVVGSATTSDAADLLAGGGLARLCANAESNMSAAICASYLRGINDTHQLLRSLGHAPGWCVPPDIMPAELSLAVVDFANANPSVSRSEPPAGFAVLALSNKWPCAREAPKGK